MDIILELKNIKHSFTRDNEVLKDISLQVNRGEIITILGPSGCGKTTLLRIVAGLEEQSAGTVSIDNELVSGHLNHVNTEERNIGLVVQERALFPHLSIMNNVKFGIKGTNKNNTERAMSLLKLFSVERYAKNYPHEISSGEQQRVALARMLLENPNLVVLDEATSALDVDTEKQVVKHLEGHLDEMSPSDTRPLLILEDGTEIEVTSKYNFSKNEPPYGCKEYYDLYPQYKESV